MKQNEMNSQKAQKLTKEELEQVNGGNSVNATMTGTWEEETI